MCSNQLLINAEYDTLVQLSSFLFHFFSLLSLLLSRFPLGNSCAQSSSSSSSSSPESLSYAFLSSALTLCHSSPHSLLPLLLHLFWGAGFLADSVYVLCWSIKEWPEKRRDARQETTEETKDCSRAGQKLNGKYFSFSEEKYWVITSKVRFLLSFKSFL